MGCFYEHTHTHNKGLGREYMGHAHFGVQIQQNIWLLTIQISAGIWTINVQISAGIKTVNTPGLQLLQAGIWTINVQISAGIRTVNTPGLQLLQAGVRAQSFSLLSSHFIEGN